MPILFYQGQDGGWAALRLTKDCVVVYQNPLRMDEGSSLGVVGKGACTLVRWGTPSEWAVLVPTGTELSVNDTPVSAGIRLLRHRDALRLEGGKPIYHSVEEIAVPVRFMGTTDAVHCPRCRGEIVVGQRAVKCPACKVLHHEEEDGLNCWTYADTCSVCNHPTALDAGLQWTPEGL